MPSRPLVIQHLEDVDAALLEKHQDVIRDYIRRKHGIYALYKNDRLYYVGLASSLSGRLRQHLRDRHRGKWNRFSVYLTRRADHIRELESIVLRIVQPDGNKQLGKFPGSTNLARTLRADIKAHHKQELDHLVGRGKRRAASNTKTHSPKPTSPGDPPLRKHLTRGMALRATVNGETIRARALKNGWIRYDGWDYFSPTHAAEAATGRRRDGWRFWKYQASPGEWVALGEIRQ